MKLNKLKLSEEILAAIDEMGYENATPVQELAIPKIMEGKDVIGLAQTGTGKTAAFALPMIDKLIKNYEADRKIKTLILVPTRELAIQTRDNILLYAKHTNFKASVIMGGANVHSQKEVLKKGVDILIATPGRLVDFINQKKVHLENVNTLILDEADTMLDMGFIKDIKTIISLTPQARQTLLFSATMPNEVKDLTVKFMYNPVHIKTNKDEITAENIRQEVYYVDTPNKINLLFDLISTKENPRTLIFTRTKGGANELEEELAKYKIKTSVIHGDKSQSNRIKALRDFKSGKARIMVATDIAARGLDISGLDLVINYDIPEKPEIYVHRIGRTARAGNSGVALSLCSSKEITYLHAINRLIGKKIELVENKKYPMELNEKRDRVKKLETKKPFSKKKNFNTNNSKSNYGKKNGSTSSYGKKTTGSSSNSYSKQSTSSYGKRTSSSSSNSYSKQSTGRRNSSTTKNFKPTKYNSNRRYK